MSENKGSSSLNLGIVLIFLGVAFLLDEFYIIDFGDLISTFWPLVLVFIGIRFILNRDRKESSANGPDNLASDAEKLNQSQIFGDIDLSSQSDSFAGGNISTIFGDVRIDLTKVTMAPGENVMTINSFAGDIRVDVSARIKWAVRANVIIGDVKIEDNKNDGFLISKTHYSEGYSESDSRLYLSISQVLGDIEVRQVTGQTDAVVVKAGKPVDVESEDKPASKPKRRGTTQAKTQSKSRTAKPVAVADSGKAQTKPRSRSRKKTNEN